MTAWMLVTSVVEVLDQLRDGDVHHRLVEDHQNLRGRQDR
jgi:hypothetical protein